MVEVPADFEAAVEMFRLVFPLPGAARVADEKLVVMPLGTPLTENATAELKPFTKAEVSVRCVEPPEITLALVVLEVRVKPGVRMVRLMD